MPQRTACTFPNPLFSCLLLRLIIWNMDTEKDKNQLQYKNENSFRMWWPMEMKEGQREIRWISDTYLFLYCVPGTSSRFVLCSWPGEDVEEQYHAQWRVGYVRFPLTFWVELKCDIFTGEEGGVALSDSASMEILAIPTPLTRHALLLRLPTVI